MRVSVLLVSLVALGGGSFSSAAEAAVVHVLKRFRTDVTSRHTNDGFLPGYYGDLTGRHTGYVAFGYDPARAHPGSASGHLYFSEEEIEYAVFGLDGALSTTLVHGLLDVSIRADGSWSLSFAHGKPYGGHKVGLGSGPLFHGTLGEWEFAKESDSEDPSVVESHFGVLSPVPVPTALPLLATGLGGLALARRRRRQAA